VTNRPVKVRPNLAGIRMRTVAPSVAGNHPCHGCHPDPDAWAETYSAIQQKVIDGAEAQLPRSWIAALRGGQIHRDDRAFLPHHRSGDSAKWLTRCRKVPQGVALEALKSGDHTSR
jgi:hypothetical protein